MPPMLPPSNIVYPESDGLPMSDNTKQFRWIITLATNLASLFRNDDDVFVSGNQFWYPVEGEPSVVASPDVYVVFGRPKGDRPSYKQWEEGDIPMTVVFEVMSPSNTAPEMAAKFEFYEDHGVEEYYIYDPDTDRLQGFRRQGSSLLRVRPIHEYSSPRMGIQFDTSGEELVVRYPDGRPFLTREEREDEIERQTVVFQQRLDQSEQGQVESERLRLEAEQQRQEAEQQRQEAEQQRQEAEQREQNLQHRLEDTTKHAARLSELTRRVLQQQATDEELEELAELQRLFEE